MKRLLPVVAALVIALVAVLVGRAATVSSRQLAVDPATVTVDEVGAARRLARAVTYRTVSTQDGPFAAEEFAGLHAFLREAYPVVHARFPPQDVGGTLHFTWPGSDRALPHVVLLAHLDVVPVEPGTVSDWAHPPFAGVVADGFVWGRGALDDKQNALGILEAAEILLREGFTPARTVHLVLGHDEEVLGTGAAAVAASLAGTPVEAVYDEGLVVGDGLVPGIPGEVALIGVTEKGYLTLELEAHGPSGHSSMPPPESSVGILANALARLEASPMPAGLDGPAGMLFDWAAPEMDFGNRVLFANRWFFGPVIRRVMEGRTSANASLRTTTAPTMLRGSVKENVLPRSAVATVNFRIHPRDSVASVIAHVERVVADERVEVRITGDAYEPAPVAPVDGFGFLALQRAVGEVFHGVPVAPGMMVGYTDSRRFLGLTPNVYRFQPVVFTAADLERLHGTDERISVAANADVVRFYARLLTHAGARP